MNANEYQELAMKTAVYPGRGPNITYPIMKLCGEVSELVEKQSIDASTTELVKESGDVCWYISAILNQLGLRFSDISNVPIYYKNNTTQLVIHSGQIAETWGKCLRDDNGILSDEKRDKIIHHLAHLYGYLDKFVNHYGFTLAEVFDINIEKLQSRAERGVLGGSGDNR